MEKELVEAGIARGDYRAIKLKLRELGFHSLLVKGAHTPVRFKCRSRHEWTATPMEAIADGCPDCELIRSINEDPAPVYSFADFQKAVNRQHKFLKEVAKRTKRRLINAQSRAPVGKYGI